MKIGKALEWSRNGQDRFQKAKESLSPVSAWDKILSFGFNWEGPVSKILALDKGERFAALSACLSEIYAPNVIAKIFTELLNLSKEGNQDDPYLDVIYIPSLSQIRTVIERFAGIFSTSDFAVLMEEFMSYDGHAVITGGTQARKRMTRTPTFRSIAYPEYVADALYELFQLSRDPSRTRQIQFVGGADAIAVAAIGIYLLDLPTEIHQDDQGALKSLHKNYESAKKPRVVVTFSDNMQLKTKSTQSRIVYIKPMEDVI